MGAGELGQLETIAQKTHPDPQHMESSVLNLALTAFPAGDSPRREALVVQRHDGQVGKRLGCGQPRWGALCFYSNEEGTQLGQTMAVHRHKNIFLHVLWLGLCCVL